MNGPLGLQPWDYWELEDQIKEADKKAIKYQGDDFVIKDKLNSLSEADHIINGERQDQYGKPEDSFEIIAGFWRVYLRGRFIAEPGLTALDVAHMMTLFKIARMLGQKPKRDKTMLTRKGILP